MPQEIERKFFIQQLPDFLENQPFDLIKQGYLAIEAGGNEVRIRKKGTKFWLTTKSSGGINRLEVEIPISEPHFDQLWKVAENRCIEKKRYIFTTENHEIEIDVFMGHLTGLVLAEVEFSTVEAAHQFVPLKWMTKDVTSNPNFKNRALVDIKNYQSILELL